MGRRPRRSPKPRTAVAYLRVSTNEERQKLGAEAQRQAIEVWAAREGITVVAWHLEEVSGGAPLDERPVLVQALADVEVLGAAFLAVQRLDRFSRDPLTAALAEATLQRHGAALACVLGGGSGDDPSAELMRAVLVAVGRFERRLTAARIKAALDVKRGRGEMTGAAPFGHRLGPDGVHLEPAPEEQAVISQVVELEAAGGTVRGIAAELARRGIVGRAGKPLTRDAVHKIVRRGEGASPASSPSAV